MCAKEDRELAERVIADCHSMKDLYIEIEGRIEHVRNMACDIGDMSDAADAATALASLLRGLADMNAEHDEQRYEQQKKAVAA